MKTRVWPTRDCLNLSSSKLFAAIILSLLYFFYTAMGFLVYSLRQRVSVSQYIARRYYTSDITAKAMVYSDYGQPSQVLR